MNRAAQCQRATGSVEGNMYRLFHILLVEDDPNDRVLTAHELNARFSGVVVRQEWERPGLTAALEEGGFDLVITDFDLGWTNGLALLEEIKGRWPRTPVIVFSGNPSAPFARAVIEAGAHGFVEKSSRGFSELLAMVEKLWAEVPPAKRAL